MLDGWWPVTETLGATCQGVLGTRVCQQGEWIAADPWTGIKDEEKTKAAVSGSGTGATGASSRAECV